jgi:hypothetical protein
MPEIFKLQRSLETNDPRGPLMLIYNQNKDVFLEGPYESKYDEVFEGKPKVYIEGEILIDDDTGKRMFGLIKVVENQNW